MKYHIITYGCQMNHSDSERIAAVLELAGFSASTNIQKADLLLINSCSVRQSAINRIYGQLDNLRTKPSLRKVLTGCVLPADKKRLSGKFDLIIDIQELTKDPKKLIDSLNIKGEEFKAFGYMDYFKINPQYRSNFGAYIPIMTGCNNFCSYCAVPHTRGREISRAAEEIVVEIKRLIDRGYKEITLLGQNVNSYRSLDKNEKTVDFPRLLKTINDIPGDFWIRFLTSHPKDMSNGLIKTMVKCEKVCEYIHLPIQAGDDEILRKMNRHYTAKQYLELIKKIRTEYKKRKVNPAITTDIIVGFPSETKAQFINTAKIMRKVKYDMGYLAEYSPRPGTAAAKMEDNVPVLEKKRRKEFLNEILKKTALANNKKYVGKIVEVLIEKNNGDHLFSKTRTFRNVKILLGNKRASPDRIRQLAEKAGQFARVKITKAGSWGLEGKIA